MRGAVEFTLDGRTVSAPEGELLVHAAARHGVGIPTLCHDDKLDPYGGCRMCVVAVEGSPRPLPACATRVAEGMVVSTNELGAAVPEDADRDAARRAPEPEPRRAPERAARHGRASSAPRRRSILPDAKREPYEDRNRLMGYDAGRVHPLQPLRALHAGGDAVLRALASRGAGRHARDRADARPLLARHRVRALRRLPLRLPDRRDLREVRRGRAGRPRAGARQGQVDVHVLRRRLPDRHQRRSGRRSGS